MRVLKNLTLSQAAVILLSLLTLALGLANLGRAMLAVRYLIRLPALPTTVSLYYLAASGGVWAVMLIACTAGLSLFREWGRRGALAAVTLYQMNVWVDRLLFSLSDYARQTLPRDLVLTLLLLLIFWIPLNLPHVKRAFRTGQKQESFS